MASPDERRSRWLLGLGAGGMFATLLAFEIGYTDGPFDWLDLVPDLIEWTLLIGCSVAFSLLSFRVRAQGEESELLRRDFETIRARSEKLREEMGTHLRGLGAVIQSQFDAWTLSEAEQAVGLLLLKGFSHKEIAQLRRTTEATIRQQAAAVYRKADLSGRAALSAFFLEELLLPNPSVAAGMPIGAGTLDGAREAIRVGAGH
jgi:DNA-binding CsgD family transcriptional regulator